MCCELDGAGTASYNLLWETSNHFESDSMFMYGQLSFISTDIITLNIKRSYKIAPCTFIVCIKRFPSRELLIYCSYVPDRNPPGGFSGFHGHEPSDPYNLMYTRALVEANLPVAVTIWTWYSQTVKQFLMCVNVQNIARPRARLQNISLIHAKLTEIGKYEIERQTYRHTGTLIHKLLYYVD